MEILFLIVGLALGVVIAFLFFKGKQNSGADTSLLDSKINELDKSTNKMFKVVFERLDDLDSQVTHDIKTSRKKIGLKPQGN